MKTSEELNKYYKIINDHVDAYLEKWKISPFNLKKYLMRNEKMTNFLKKRGLSDIKLIDRVISDVIDDRVSMERDTVKKFENFIIKESNSYSDESECLKNGIDKTNVEHEKILADMYDVSLSEIDVVNTEDHIFRIGDKKYIIYTNSEVDTIKDNVNEYIQSNLLKKSIQFSIGEEKISIPSGGVIDSNNLSRSINDQTTRSINKLILSILKMKYPSVDFEKSTTSHFICEIK